MFYIFFYCICFIEFFCCMEQKKITDQSLFGAIDYFLARRMSKKEGLEKIFRKNCCFFCLDKNGDCKVISCEDDIAFNEKELSDKDKLPLIDIIKSHIVDGKKYKGTNGEIEFFDSFDILPNNKICLVNNLSQKPENLFVLFCFGSDNKLISLKSILIVDDGDESFCSLFSTENNEDYISIYRFLSVVQGEYFGQILMLYYFYNYYVKGIDREISLFSTSDGFYKNFGFKIKGDEKKHHFYVDKNDVEKILELNCIKK
jgi:hypothetical protein